LGRAGRISVADVPALPTVNAWNWLQLQLCRQETAVAEIADRTALKVWGLKMTYKQYQVSCMCAT